MNTSAAHNGSAHVPTVSLVIPAKDEAKNVAWVLRRLPPGIHEVILVDGHSADDTVDVAQAVYPEIIVVKERGPGKGAAMRTGMDIATGELIVLIDADGSMDPRELYRYVEAAHDSDFIKGSRFTADGGSEDISVTRRLGNRTLLGLVNFLYGARLTDLCYGYMAVRRGVLPAMALRAEGFEIETEMTARALRCGLRISEVPSFEAPRRYGESHLRTMRDGWRVLRTLLRERFRRQTEAREAELPVPGTIAPATLAPPGATTSAVIDAALTLGPLTRD
jgi:glycosyltransferase involved in cell wall biosynthesis